MLLVVLQGYFSYYLCDGEHCVYSPSVVTPSFAIILFFHSWENVCNFHDFCTSSSCRSAVTARAAKKNTAERIVKSSNFNLFECINGRNDFSSTSINSSYLHITLIGLFTHRRRNFTGYNTVKNRTGCSFHFFNCLSSWMRSRPLSSLTGPLKDLQSNTSCFVVRNTLLKSLRYATTSAPLTSAITNFVCHDTSPTFSGLRSVPGR